MQSYRVREPERFLDMGPVLLSATGKSLAVPNKRVRNCKIGIKCQRPFKLGNALGHPVREDLHVTPAAASRSTLSSPVNAMPRLNNLAQAASLRTLRQLAV
jgi:hypothetical protein